MAAGALDAVQASMLDVGPVRLGRAAVPLGLLFLALLALWTVFGPAVTGLISALRHPRRLLRRCGCHRDLPRSAARKGGNRGATISCVRGAGAVGASTAVC